MFDRLRPQMELRTVRKSSHTPKCSWMVELVNSQHYKQSTFDTLLRLIEWLRQAIVLISFTYAVRSLFLLRCCANLSTVFCYQYLHLFRTKQRKKPIQWSKASQKLPFLSSTIYCCGSVVHWQCVQNADKRRGSQFEFWRLDVNLPSSWTHRRFFHDGR